MAPRKWEPSPEDAMSLAAIRWFACTLEARAIELYATDRGTYDHIERVLRASLKELRSMEYSEAMAAEDCPDGYMMCNGICKPQCYEAEEASYAAGAVAGETEATERTGRTEPAGREGGARQKAAPAPKGPGKRTRGKAGRRR